MPSARISINVDAEVKKNAQRILGEIGLDLTTAVDLLLRTIIREERIPFDLETEKAYREENYRNYVNNALELSMLEAMDPETKMMSYEEIKEIINEKRKSRK